jgi:hypothetical protein
MILEAADPMEANVCLALLHEPGGENDCKLVNVAIGAEVNLSGDATLAAAQASREAGNAPNSVLAAAASIVGPRRQDGARKALRELIDQFAKAGLRTEGMNPLRCEEDATDAFERETRPMPDPKAGDASRLKTRGAIGIVRYSKSPRASDGRRGIATLRLPKPLMRKRISANGGKLPVAAPVGNDRRTVTHSSTLPEVSAEFPSRTCSASAR